MEWIEFTGKVLIILTAIWVVLAFCLMQAFFPINDKEPPKKVTRVWLTIMVGAITALVMYGKANILIPL